MINTFFSNGLLGTSAAFFAALVIGFLFGFVLERAGFGSSRTLAGIFYFRDMTVLKVMFTGVITTMIGLSYFLAFGILNPDSVYFMSTKYGAQIIGGLIFGIGFVMGGWCPGTAAVGVASGKIDALLFLGGAVFGSVIFNELFPIVKGIFTWGDSGVQFIWESIGVSKPFFVSLFTMVGIAAFYASEWVEKKVSGTGDYLDSRFLKGFSVILVSFSLALFIFPTVPGAMGVTALNNSVELSCSSTDKPENVTEQELLTEISEAEDHVSPMELADELINGSSITLIDVRPVNEYNAYHIKNAVNVEIPQLVEFLNNEETGEKIVLYSNGMTHPAQARDSLIRQGFKNVFILTDGINGFKNEVLKPASLRNEPLNEEQINKINVWRKYFL